MSTTKIAPGRLAALRLVATGSVRISDPHHPRAYFSDMTNSKYGKSLDSTPYRWLVTQSYAEGSEAIDLYLFPLVITPAGQAVLDANPTPAS